SNSIKRTSAVSNIVIHGFVSPSKVNRHMKEMDVLLMPYQEKVLINNNEKSDTAPWMSPMKLFEYLGSGVPILSSDLPVLREILIDKKNALLIPAGDKDCWQQGLETLKNDYTLRTTLSENAGKIIDEYTWDRRVKHIVRESGLSHFSYEMIACPVCGSQEKGSIVLGLTTEQFGKKWLEPLKKIRITQKQKHFLVKCLQCHFIFVNPQLSRREWKKLYSEVKREKITPDEKNVKVKKNEALKLVARLQKQFRKKDISVLDYGCGFGILLEVARECGCIVTGVEIDPVRVSYCRSKELPVMTFEDFMSLENKKMWDVICFNQVLEHVKNPHEIIQLLKKYVHKKGIFFVSLPSYKCISREKKKGVYKTVHLLEHLNYFSIKTLDLLFKENGFKPITLFVVPHDAFSLKGVIKDGLKKLQMIFLPNWTPLWINRIYYNEEV
ncbi:methyltransferase domain-containing protein, partial [Chlamydiota bacterium]